MNKVFIAIYEYYILLGKLYSKVCASRLSNIRILQWRAINATLIKQEVGVYEPNYEIEVREGDEDAINGNMIVWKEENLKWASQDGRKPLDNPVECGILSSFATDMNMECQLAITIAFLIVLSAVIFILLIFFLVQKKR